MDTVDLLVFGPHPDDIEIGLGGTVARHVALGARVGLCDLTAGELGSNGTVDERLAEADEALRVLGAAWRTNLRFPDGHLGTDDQLSTLVERLRRWRPRVVAAPFRGDRHPDHCSASDLLTRAVFQAGLRRVPGGDPWHPEWTCYYFINDAAPPSFVVDVSAHYETKRRALACHRTQFEPSAPDRIATRLTTPRFRQLIESRDAQFGAQAGVAFAEGVVVREPVVREHLFRRADSADSDPGARP